ncbi:MAG TPA: tRNA pseudouridine(55) synthase TruB [Lachnospiraceae bacterium]|nr:tRNA pseudouridine(55) synthase TruB [Lachnospiraceae bacterium]
MINGIINVYKEKGFTSHDVVAKLRGIVGQKKIGHTGTLDPDAVGVLPVCLGKATKLCGMITDETKTYETCLLLGKDTDTQDISGRIIEEKEVFCTEEDVRNTVKLFEGEQKQIPPMYSALKKDGKRLYELARAGITVEREARTVNFYEIRIRKMELPRVWLRVTCSKGTYIRTLCHDIGEKLGCGGCMEELVRTRTGKFSAENALKLSEIEAIVKDGRLSSILIPADEMFAEFSAGRAKPQGDAILHNGNPIDPEYLQEIPEKTRENLYRIYDSKNHFIGVYIFDKKAQKYRLQTMFYDPSENA